jgi:hypothetical protein
VEPLTGPVPVPDSLRRVMDREPRSRVIPADSGVLRELL